MANPFLSTMAIRAVRTAVPRHATHAFVAPFASASINIERTARDAAVVSWAAPAAPSRAAYVFEYGLSRRATLHSHVEVRNLTPGEEYKCRVWRSDTGAEVASGTLNMSLSDPAAGSTSAPAPATQAEQAELPLTELSRLEVRVGVITEIAKHPDADSLYVEKVDVGEEQPRTIVSGLVKFCSEEELLNRRVVVLCNLKPRAMRGVTSHGMLLCASDGDHSKVDPLLPPDDAPLGELITFDGHRTAPVDPGNRATKAFDRVADKLSCGEDGIARFEDVPFMTSKGACTSPKKLVGPVS